MLNIAVPLHPMMAARQVSKPRVNGTAASDRQWRVRDEEADPVAVGEALRNEPLIGAVVARDPGRRVPGSADGFELAVRTVIGQQISVKGASTVSGRW